jgi:hypothetical protein
LTRNFMRRTIYAINAQVKRRRVRR